MPTLPIRKDVEVITNLLARIAGSLERIANTLEPPAVTPLEHEPLQRPGQTTTSPTAYILK